jgi:hypothetical protein
MASHIEGMAFPLRTNGLTWRLRERITQMVESLKARDEIRSSLPLVPGERVLTMTCDLTGSWVAASERALYHCDGAPSRVPVPQEWVRLGWEEIGQVTWDDTESTLTLTGLLPTVPRRTVLHLPSAPPLTSLAKERVSWTAVLRTEIELGEHGTARVIGRRRPGADELTWLVGLDGERDAPDVQASVEAALDDLRGRLGL